MYLSTILEDFSRYIIVLKLGTTMKAGDVNNTLTRAQSRVSLWVTSDRAIELDEKGKRLHTCNLGWRPTSVDCVENSHVGWQSRYR